MIKDASLGVLVAFEIQALFALRAGYVRLVYARLAHNHFQILFEVFLLHTKLIKHICYACILVFALLTRRQILIVSLKLFEILNHSLHFWLLIVIQILRLAPLFRLKGVWNDHRTAVIDLDQPPSRPTRHLMLALPFLHAHPNRGWQVVLLHLGRVELDWLLREDCVGHARPQILPAGLVPARLDIRTLNVPLRDQLVHHLLAVKRQLPLRKALVAVATLALFIKHFLQIELEIAEINLQLLALLRINGGGTQDRTARCCVLVVTSLASSIGLLE